MSLPVLCRAGGHTCGACCHGDLVPRERLARTLARHERLFGWLMGQKPPGVARLLLHELLVRGFSGVLWSVVLLLPLVGECLSLWLRRRVVCAFLAYEDGDRTRVGCLIHPARWQGRDVRGWAAFSLWRGLGCGAGEWLCPGARRFQVATWQQRRAFLNDAGGCDWHEFGQRVTRYGSEAPRE